MGKNYLILFDISCSFFSFSGHQSEVFCISFSFMIIWRKYHNTSRNRHFSYPNRIQYWSGFGIFKQNRDNPDEIGMVGQSVFIFSWFTLVALFVKFTGRKNISLRRFASFGVEKKLVTPILVTLLRLLLTTLNWYFKTIRILSHQ